MPSQPLVPNDPPPRTSRGSKGSGNFGGIDRKLSRETRSPKDSRTLSQRFIRAPQFDTSHFVWIENDKKIWTLCTILRQDNTVLKLQDLDSSNMYKIDIGFDELKLCNKLVLSDMSKLQHVHEPAILHNLSHRFLHQHEFFTYIGRNVLVSVNPFTWKFPLAATMRDYFECDSSDSAPHPYVLAEQAFQGISASTPGHPKHRSIVISGDSGSGKTETSKLVLHYLAKRAETETGSGAGAGAGFLSGSEMMLDSSSHSTTAIAHSIMQASPILEAFGNAKTSHNPNSSRFGRYVKMVFSGESPVASMTPRSSSSSSSSSSSLRSSLSLGSRRPSFSSSSHIPPLVAVPAVPVPLETLGAQHEIYLLEKSRVLGQAPGEQNFHIFYQYLSGLLNSSLHAGHLAAVPGLSDLDSFRLLNPCDSLDVMFVKFKETQNALCDIMTKEAITELWSVIGGILQLGNVEFFDNETPEGNTAYVSSVAALQSACTLLGVDWKEMRNLMTQKVIETRDERFVVSLTHEGAVATRDAICKAIYDTLFRYVVASINDTLSNHNDLKDKPFVGVLDLFGFETMAINGFDQFMINYANEAMQNCFNRCILQAELNLYATENIQCSLNLDECPNNSGCLDLIAFGIPKSKCPSSILLILDSISQQPKGTDDKFCEGLHKSLGSNSDFAAQNESMTQHFLYTHPKDQRHLFRVKHYAGVVTYAVHDMRVGGDNSEVGRSGWVESNRDAIPCALGDIMTSSANSLLQKFKFDINNTTSISPNSNSLSRQKLRTQSVATSFSSSIRDLCNMLESTECAFIRCIKPNHTMTPGVVDNACMINQIRSLALVQTSQVQQVGLKTNLKVSFTGVLDYISSTLCTKEDYRHLLAHTPRLLVATWLTACGIPEKLFSVGKSKVFFRDGFHSQVGVSTSHVWEDETSLIASLSALLPPNQVLNSIHEILLAKKQRETACVKYRSRADVLQSKLGDVRSHLQSKQMQTSSIPSLAPFLAFFKLTDEANSGLQVAHFQADVVNNRLKALEVAISSSTAPANEAERMHSEVLGQVVAIRSALSLLPDSVATINAYESEVRTAVLKVQDEFNDTAMRCWDNISLADKTLEAISGMVAQLEGEGGGASDLPTRIEEELTTLSTLLAEQLPNPYIHAAEENTSEKHTALWACNESMIELAAEVIAKSKDVVAKCDDAKQQCVEAEEELQESKKTLSFFEKVTRKILGRATDDEEEPGSTDGRAQSFLESISESTVEDKGDNDTKSTGLSEENMIADEAGSELDEDSSVNPKSLQSSASTVSMGQGRRLTTKSLRIIQRGGSGLSGGADSFQSFTAEMEDFSGDDDDDDDDDDNLSVIDMDFWIIPCGWVEYFDTDSQCSYYLNTITQTTQWERPEQPAEGMASSVTWVHDKGDTSDVGGDANTKEEIEPKEVEFPVPRNHVSDLTPIAEEKNEHINEDDEMISKDEDDEHGDKTDAEDKGYTSKLKTVIERKLWSTKSQEEEEEVVGFEMNNEEKEKDEEDGKSASDSSRSSSPIVSVKTTASKCNLSYGRVTTSQLDMLQTLPKEGHLMKQSSSFFFSRWNRKYFVLNGLRLECYDTSEHYFYGLRKPLVMVLTLSTCTSFTDDANTFIVKTTDASGHTVAWTLAAPNHTEKNEWVTYINAHVYTHHCNEIAQLKVGTSLDRRLLSATKKGGPRKSLTPDDVASAGFGVTFWQLTQAVPGSGSTGGTSGGGQTRGGVHRRGSSTQVLPVGIRTLPDMSSSRTGEGVFPGEHVEVVSTREEDNLTYLELADHRGWVFSLHPNNATSMFVPAVGYTYRILEQLRFQVAATETEGVPIQYNPGDCSPYTGACLEAGEIVETTASFVLDMDLRHSLYVKLADGRGWVNTRGKDGGIGVRALE